jgi:hypothetical protein
MEVQPEATVPDLGCAKISPLPKVTEVAFEADLAYDHERSCRAQINVQSRSRWPD